MCHYPPLETKPSVIIVMKTKIVFFILLSIVAISCKNGNGKKTESSVPVTEDPVKEQPKLKVATLTNIGSWTMPITDKISNRVTLKFDPFKKKYYTLEKMSNANRTDSSGVIITKKGQGYHIEYSGSMKDNYTIDELGTIIWDCPGYSSVRCRGTINMNNLVETFKTYKPDSKARWVNTSSLSPEQASKVFDWSKRYVKACVVQSESLVFPEIKDVKFFSRNGDNYKIEYKATGKNLYNKSVTYPVSIVFDNPDEPIFHTISLE